jgi:thiosulfate/3-mercaptopyruvate sulfurtransferase
MQRGFVTLVLALTGFAATTDPVLVQPKDFAGQLQAKGPKPSVLYIGFAVMYRNKHIPEAVLAGPTSRPQGLDELKTAASKLPRDRELVIYCGCCPWDQCPNVKPALALLKQMGFTNVKTLMIATNFATDWVDHGYPVEAGKPETK